MTAWIFIEASGGFVVIDWARTEAGHFERIVDVLLRREYGEHDVLADEPGARLVFPDGRGGDGGRDAELVGPGRQVIFQLKHFVDGFPSSNRSRRQQITASFDTAMRHGPTHWCLVVPAKLTDGERAFVTALASRPTAAQGLVIEIIDRPWLDERAARHPDVDFHFTRSDEVFERVREFNAQQQMLDGPDDLVARVSALGGVADARDMDWAMDFSRHGEVVTQTLRARHARAHEVSPITIGLSVRIEEGEADLAQAIRASLGYGEPGELTVPARNITRLHVQGPPWLARDEDDVDVTWYPTPGPPPFSHVEVRFLDHDGVLLAAEEGTVEHAGQGWEGFSLHARFHDALTMRWRFPHDVNAQGNLTYTLQMAGIHPAAALGGIDLVRWLHRATVVELWLGEHRLVALNGLVSNAEYDQWLDELDTVALLAEDLAIVQRHCRQRFPIPETLLTIERIEIRVARLLLEGKRTAHPLLREITTTIDTAAEPRRVEMLHTLLEGGGGHFSFEIANLVIAVSHRQLALGPARVYIPNAVINQRENLVAALEAGATEVPLSLGAANGGCFSCLLPAHVDQDQRLPLTLWDLPGVKEPGQLEPGAEDPG